MVIKATIPRAIQCNETGRIVSPFYVMQAVIRGNGRVAHSNDVVFLADEVTPPPRGSINRIKNRIEEGVSFAIQGVGYNIETLPSGYPTTSYARSKDVYYVSKDYAEAYAPRSVNRLLSNPNWEEKVGGEWRPAQWAEELYARLVETNPHAVKVTAT